MHFAQFPSSYQCALRQVGDGLGDVCVPDAVGVLGRRPGRGAEGPVARRIVRGRRSPQGEGTLLGLLGKTYILLRSMNYHYGRINLCMLGGKLACTKGQTGSNFMPNQNLSAFWYHERIAMIAFYYCTNIENIYTAILLQRKLTLNLLGPTGGSAK